MDRRAIVKLYGGPRLAQPSCQVLPPGLPGYEPYCPYPLDLPAARRLVAESGTAGQRLFVGHVSVDGVERSISGRGNGLISGVIDALGETGPSLDVVDYSEHAIGHGADAQAAAYVECRTADGRTVFGVGLDTDIATASVRAVLSAANRSG